jgi:hypothetical protein
MDYAPLIHLTRFLLWPLLIEKSFGGLRERSSLRAKRSNPSRHEKKE